MSLVNYPLIEARHPIKILMWDKREEAPNPECPSDVSDFSIAVSPK
jgi:hypothetical protein